METTFSGWCFQQAGELLDKIWQLEMVKRFKKSTGWPENRLIKKLKTNKYLDCFLLCHEKLQPLSLAKLRFLETFEFGNLPPNSARPGFAMEALYKIQALQDQPEIFSAPELHGLIQ